MYILCPSRYQRTETVCKNKWTWAKLRWGKLYALPLDARFEFLQTLYANKLYTNLTSETLQKELVLISSWAKLAYRDIFCFSFENFKGGNISENISFYLEWTKRTSTCQLEFSRHLNFFQQQLKAAIARKFFTLGPSSKKSAKSISWFFSLGRIVQNSDLVHFLEDGKTFSYFKPPLIKNICNYKKLLSNVSKTQI